MNREIETKSHSNAVPPQVASESPATLDDPRVTRAVEEYVAATKAGCKPDRQEFLARYSGISPALAECLDGLDFIQAAAPELQETATTIASLQACLATPLGDFHIVREIGRGGMGVVYEAVQISLGRRVALKVLPFAAALDAKQLQRFKNEAQAAAHLQHQNIVPVYYVGCERGVHFYAMQFIDGQTLAAVIRELRPAAACDDQVARRGAEDAEPVSALSDQALCSLRLGAQPGSETGPVAALSTERSIQDPAFFRTVAQLGAQAAEALEHAHQLGVIHRDIKPANLLVEWRAEGVSPPLLWITDFGLAHCQSQPGLTLTGDVLGTLRYMSPEQALAKRVPVDPRTDIYSLGVTLYDLLTLEPAYNGRDREELLRQIAFEEPRPPRRLNPAVPAELETIVLKAMAKSPEERYATAQELADDLRRFLEDKPIKAKRPSLWQRAAKWARRHKTVVRAAVAVLMLAVVGLAVSTALIWRANRELRRNSYYQLIALTEREWSANDVSRMQQLLDNCPEDLRGWEWRYLQRLRSRTLPPLRHDSSVLSVAFSPDGRRLAASSVDGTVKVWDASTAREVHSFRAHKARVRGIAFSPGGQLLASAGSDNLVKVWDTTSWQERLIFQRHTKPVRGVAYSPDGRRIASAGADNTVRVWDAQNGQEVFTLAGHDSPVVSVAFSPDGHRLASASAQIVKLWDTHTGQEQLTLRGHDQPVQGVAFSPDSRRLASVAGILHLIPDQEVKVWDARTGHEILSLRGHAGGVRSVAFSPDGHRLASAGLDQTVKLWDLATGQEILTLRGHIDHVYCVAFSPDGQQLVSGSLDKTVRIWDATPVGQEPGPEYLTLRGHTGAVTSVAFHPVDGRSLASTGRDGTVRVWDAWSGKELSTLPAAGGLRVAYSPDGRYLAAVSGDADRTARVSDTTTAKETCTFRGHTDLLRCLAFSPDGRHVASAGFDSTVRVWEATTGKEVQALKDHNWPIQGVAFRPPDGRHVASGSADSTVRIWDWTTGQELCVLQPRHAARVASVTFRRDGALLASASWDRTVKVWDAQTWKLLHDLHDPTGAPQCVTFDRQRQRLAWGSTDSTVKVWDGPGTQTHVLRGHTSWVLGVAFSPDGQWIASAGLDGTVKIWKAPPEPGVPAPAAGDLGKAPQ